MPRPSFLIPLGLVALLAGCQAPAKQGNINELPQNNPTATSTGLADEAQTRH